MGNQSCVDNLLSIPHVKVCQYIIIPYRKPKCQTNCVHQLSNTCKLGRPSQLEWEYHDCNTPTHNGIFTPAWWQATGIAMPLDNKCLHVDWLPWYALSDCEITVYKDPVQCIWYIGYCYQYIGLLFICHLLDSTGIEPDALLIFWSLENFDSMNCFIPNRYISSDQYYNSVQNSRLSEQHLSIRCI